MKLDNILLTYQILNKLGEKEKHIPSRMGLSISRNLEKMKTAVKDFEKARIEVAKHHCLKDEDGNPVMNKQGNFTIPPENIPAFNEEIDELLTADLEMIFDKVLMADIERCDSDDKFDALDLNELKALDYMLETTE